MEATIPFHQSTESRHLKMPLCRASMYPYNNSEQTNEFNGMDAGGALLEMSALAGGHINKLFLQSVFKQCIQAAN